jgi:hypothetical protein
MFACASHVKLAPGLGTLLDAGAVRDVTHRYVDPLALDVTGQSATFRVGRGQQKRALLSDN